MKEDVLENIKKAYSAIIEKNEVGNGMYTVAALICVIILINKFISAYKEAYSGDAQRPINVKSFFTLFYTYFICAGIIIAASPVINMIEELLADVQTSFMSKFPEPKDIDGQAMYNELAEEFSSKVKEDNMIVSALESLFFSGVYLYRNVDILPHGISLFHFCSRTVSLSGVIENSYAYCRCLLIE